MCFKVSVSAVFCLDILAVFYRTVICLAHCVSYLKQIMSTALITELYTKRHIGCDVIQEEVGIETDEDAGVVIPCL